MHYQTELHCKVLLVKHNLLVINIVVKDEQCEVFGAQ